MSICDSVDPQKSTDCEQMFPGNSLLISECFKCMYTLTCKTADDYFANNHSHKVVNRFISYSSGVLLVVTGLFIITRKRFRVHPYPFIGIACLTESLFYQMNSYYNTICTLKFPVVFAFTSNLPLIITGEMTFEEAISPKELFDSLALLNTMEKYLFTFGIIANLVFNSIILIDLYLTLQRPFKQREDRAKWYYLFAFFILLPFSITFLGFDQRNPTFFDWGRKSWDNFYGLFCAVMGIVAFTATLLVLKRLTLEGTSKQLKSKVFKRHLLYAYLYLLSLIQVLVHFFHDESIEIIGQHIYDYLESLLDSLGIFLALVRLFDPYVWYDFSKFVKYLFCIKKEKLHFERLGSELSKRNQKS
jgi:hypothetical protein